MQVGETFLRRDKAVPARGAKAVSLSGDRVFAAGVF
jgi:hypothetical protein